MIRIEDENYIELELKGNFDNYNSDLLNIEYQSKMKVANGIISKIDANKYQNTVIDISNEDAYILNYHEESSSKIIINKTKI